MLYNQVTQSLGLTIFTVVCFVAWPLNDREAGGKFSLIEPPCFSYVSDAACSQFYYNKSSEVSLI